jgi:HD-GYP domain-containing protein (c-di-GMP phosphodiesterase class II)
MYVPFPLDEVELNAPLPVSIWDPSGLLLLRKGEVIRNEKHREQLHKHLPMVLQTEYKEWTYRYTSMIDQMLRDNHNLDDIAGATRPMGLSTFGSEIEEMTMAERWSDLQARHSTLMHQNVEAQDFMVRLSQIEADMKKATKSRVDDSLFVLVLMLSDRTFSYSASHALVCGLVCRMVAQTLGLEDALSTSLQRAALTMNIGMSRLHDQLARQKLPLNEAQQKSVSQHPVLGEKILRHLGVNDPVWLELVRHHHQVLPDMAGANPSPKAMAHLLLHTADVFAARISPRAARAGLPANRAARDAYLGTDGQPTPLGNAFIKTLGVYVPGSYVRLASEEVAVVVRRGRRANAPLTFAIVGRQGMPLGEPTLRDTSERTYEIKAGVSADEVKVRVNPGRLLARL